MCAKRSLIFLLFGTWVLTGCAARRYQSAPIVPAMSASRLESRSLSDPGLQAFLKENVAHPGAPLPPKTWDLDTLSLAALYFNPTLEAARARLAEAQAAIVSAGARPNPSLNLSPGIPSPYLFTLDFAVPIETAGKRGYRLQFARSLDQAARFDLADSAWKIRSGVRGALLAYLLALRNLEAVRSEEQVRTDQVKMLDQRFVAGEIPRPEVDLGRIDLSKTHLAVSAAEGQVAEAQATLAASIGIPVTGLKGFEFSWPDLDSPPSAESLSRELIRRDAVLNRLDVRRALAQYAASEANLQLEIAKQYPDVQVGPGYTYEEKHNFFTVGLSITLPLLNRNQGPIAEAEARRKESAAAFLGTQAQVIAQSEQALAAYTAALKELAEADRSLRKLQASQLQMMQRAVSVGEEDQLALNGVQLQTSVVTRARLDALSHAQTALGALEDAVQRPLDPGEAFPINLKASTLENAPPESKQ